MKIQRLVNPFDFRITEFRRKVCAENGAKTDYADQTLDYKETVKYVEQLPSPKNFEEIWKYGNTKWKKTQFDSLECIIHEGFIVGVSGCKLYTDNMLRVSMHLYILKDYRGIYRNSQFCENGLFQRHLEFAKTLGNVDCLFMTIYPYNRKLKAHIRNLAYRKISSYGRKSNKEFIENLQFIEKPINFHGVPQYFFLYALKKGFKFSLPNNK